MSRFNAIVFVADVNLPCPPDVVSPNGDLAQRSRPSFNRGLRVFRVGEVAVRRFARAAWGQFHLFEQFESLGWAPRIVDASQEEWDAVRRMQMKETVFRLNQGQEPWLIHFHCHCAERAITWEFTEQANSNLIPTAGPKNDETQRTWKAMGKPRFRTSLREFIVRGQCIARFGALAFNLVAILKKLHDSGWPRKILDPLGPSQSEKYGNWLKTAAYRLNQRQNPWLIEFHSHPRERALSWSYRIS